MSIKMLKPTTPGQRGMSKQGFEEITSTTPERSLLAKRNRTGGRNNTGHITTRHNGGGHKQRYRIIDFKRNKDGRSGQGRDNRVRSQPLRPHRAAGLRRRREALHPGPRRA